MFSLHCLDVRWDIWEEKEERKKLTWNEKTENNNKILLPLATTLRTEQKSAIPKTTGTEEAASAIAE